MATMPETDAGDRGGRGLLARIPRLLACLFVAVVVVDAAVTLAAMVEDSGGLILLSDALSWQKLGEVLVIAAWMLPAVRGRPARPSRGAWSAMLVGALMNAWAWSDLAQRTNWAPWCLAVAGFVPLAWALGRWTLSRRFLSVALALAWLSASFWGVFESGYRWYPIPDAPPEAAADRDGRRAQDLRHLMIELERHHVDMFHTTTREAFSAEVNALVADIPQLTDFEIDVRMAALVASVGDAHTSLYRSYYESAPRLPIDVEWFADGLALTSLPASLPETPGGPRRDPNTLLGARITHIDGRSVDELMAAVTRVIPHENRSWLLAKSPSLLVRPAVLHALGALGPPGETVELSVVQDTAPASLTLPLLGPDEHVDRTTRPAIDGLAERHPDQLFWWERLPAEDVVYVRYRKCHEFWAFRRFASELRDELERDPPRRLVLDLRGNTGGSSVQWSWFLMPGLRGGPLNDPERLHVLIDRGTYSSGSGNAIETARETRATLLGEPTGGALNVHGEVRYFFLPNSGIPVTYSTKYHARMPGSPDNTLRPDIEIVPTATDWLAGRDPVLERALR